MMKRREAIEREDRRKAMVLSAVIFLLVVLACFLLTAFTIQDPPPGEQYVAVGMADFGDVDEASGDNESETPSEEVEEVVDREVSQPTQNESAPEEIVTQESSEASVSTSTKPDPDPEPDPDPDPQVSSNLSNALNQINSSGGGGSQGNNQGTGNEGDPGGQIDGMGVVQGDGVGFSLAGRGMEGRPRLSEDPKEEGTVVLTIYVDPDGKVTRTSRDYAKSTTSSNQLFQLAEKAAKTARFSVKRDAPAEQKGQMTFRFKLR